MRKTTLIIIIHSLLLICSILFAVVYHSYGLKPELYLMPLSWGFVILFLWMVYTWKVKHKHLLDPYILFLIAATLFNGGFIIVMVMPFRGDVPLLDFFNLEDIFSLRQIFDTFLLVLVSLMSFHFGALLNPAKHKQKKDDQADNIELEIIKRKKLRQIGLGILFISLLPSLIMFNKAIHFSSIYGYKEGWIQRFDVSAPIRILSGLFLPGVLFVIAGSKRRWFILFLSLISLLLYSGVYLYVGARRFAVSALLAGIWTWDTCIKKIPRILLLITGMVILFGILPFVRISRQTPGVAYFDLLRFIDQYSELYRLFQESLIEIARTSKIITFTMELIPEVRPFAKGQSYINAIASIIPNLFWDVHPTAKNNLAQWFVETRFPIFARTGGGFGFSFIAEAYLNFGWIGTPLVVSVIGFFFARFVLWASESHNPLKIATVASFLYYFLLFARGESYLLPRYFLWYSVFPYLLVIYFPLIKFKTGNRD